MKTLSATIHIEDSLSSNIQNHSSRLRFDIVTIKSHLLATRVVFRIRTIGFRFLMDLNREPVYKLHLNWRGNLSYSSLWYFMRLMYGKFVKVSI